MRVSTEELKDFARLTGNNDIHKLNIKELCTVNSEISNHTEIEHFENVNERSENMKKFVCSVCGYVYNPEEGDPDIGIEPGTAFEDLSDDWACPVCSVGKEKFKVRE